MNRVTDLRVPVPLHRDAPSVPRSSTRARPSPAERRLAAAIVVLASAAWLALLWQLGLGRAVLQIARDDRVLLTFRYWAERPASEHLFLAWLSREHIEHHVAYTNHTHPYLFLL